MVAPPSIFYRFVILAIGYLNFDDYVKIRLQTPFVCHLYLHYTSNPVLKHPRSRTIRGITVPWGVYFCFTGFKTVEQDEPGDSLIHTFTVPDWPTCTTMNMITTGFVSGVESPSCGPIFSHHNPGPPAPATESQFDVSRLWSSIIGNSWGQKLWIQNRFISNLAFYLKRLRLPGGIVVFTIRSVVGDAILAQKTWGNANDIATDPQWYYVAFNDPPLIDEEVYLLVFASQGSAGVLINVYDSEFDVKPNEHMVFRHGDGTYTNHPGSDFGYYYTYWPGWIMG